jgi:hypothetical protein
MAEDFVTSIINNKAPLSNDDLSLDVVKILDAAQRSIRNNGEEVFL